MVRRIDADPWWRSMSDEEMEEFLKRPLLMRLGMIDKDGYPIVHPVWFLYRDSRFYVVSSVRSRKVKIIANNRNVYFVVDDVIDGKPRGVRGKGNAILDYDSGTVSDLMRANIIKYIGSLEKDVSKRLMDESKDSTAIVIEPLYIATWIG
jgi:hypothetical protein